MFQCLTIQSDTDPYTGLLLDFGIFTEPRKEKLKIEILHDIKDFLKLHFNLICFL